MRHRRNCWMTAFVLASSLVAGPLAAGQFEDGLAAQERGDYATAVQLWKPLAEQGNAIAQYNLAAMYAEAQGVPRDAAEALKWYRHAAGRGHAPAQLKLALMYDQGMGVPRHHSIAMKWYRLAAQQGDATAQLTLALIYDEGRGVPQNNLQAMKWYGLAAEQGLVAAQKNLGIMYEKGRGVPQDRIQAYKWLSLAAAAGESAAARDRDAVSTKMTPEQMATAKKLAVDWTLAKAQEKAAGCKDLHTRSLRLDTARVIATDHSDKSPSARDESDCVAPSRRSSGALVSGLTGCKRRWPVGSVASGGEGSVERPPRGGLREVDRQWQSGCPVKERSTGVSPRHRPTAISPGPLAEMNPTSAPDCAEHAPS